MLWFRLWTVPEMCWSIYRLDRYGRTETSLRKICVQIRLQTVGSNLHNKCHKWCLITFRPNSSSLVPSHCPHDVKMTNGLRWVWQSHILITFSTVESYVDWWGIQSHIRFSQYFWVSNIPVIEAPQKFEKEFSAFESCIGFSHGHLNFKVYWVTIIVRLSTLLSKVELQQVNGQSVLAVTQIWPVWLGFFFCRRTCLISGLIVASAICSRLIGNSAEL